MATVFTQIIEGEIPGRFVWRDERAVAFLTIAPLKPGHVLVVPREEIEHWIDLDPDLARHLFHVGQSIAKALDRVWRPAKVGLTVIGLEVPHTHLHVVPIWEIDDMNFEHADPSPPPADLDEAAGKIRAALVELGYAEACE